MDSGGGKGDNGKEYTRMNKGYSESYFLHNTDVGNIHHDAI